MHLVFYNSKYKSFDESLNHTDGLTVLGVLYQRYESDNQFLQAIVEAVREIPDYNNKRALSRPIDVFRLLPANRESFYRYQGSLTTPPCAEVVNWIVFHHLQTISHQQVRE